MGETENTTLENILTVSLNEFLEKGYQNGSLRNIAKKAGVTTGALYGYFKNKEELFEALVGEKYNYIIYMYKSILEEFSNLRPEEQSDKMDSCTAKGVFKMIDYVYENKDIFKLILCCSEGTKYNNLVHEMAEMDVKATHDFKKTSDSIGKKLKAINPILEHMLTSGMFSTFFELIIHDVPKDEAIEYSIELLDFYSAGWRKIMGF